MTQHEILKKHPLLDENGHLIEAGFAKSLILDAGGECIRFIRMNEDNYSYVVKLSLNNNKEGNSIITGIKIKTRKVNKYVLRSRIIDSKLWYYVFKLWGRNNV